MHLREMLPALKDHFFLFAYWWQKDSGHFDPLVMEHRVNGLLCVLLTLTVDRFVLLFFSFLHKWFIFSRQHHYHLDHIQEEKPSTKTIFSPPLHTIKYNTILSPQPSLFLFFNSLKSFSIRGLLWSVGEESWKCSSFSPMDTVWFKRNNGEAFYCHQG